MAAISDVTGELLYQLARAPDRALFVSELRSRLGKASTAAVEQAVHSLEGSQLLVVDHAPPDPHLDGDLRVVALVNAAGGAVAARAAADRVWSAWLRDFLSHRRCG